MEKDTATSGGTPLLSPQPARKQPMVGRLREQTCRSIPDLLRTAWASGGLHAERRAIRQQQPTCSRYPVKPCVALSRLRRPKPQPQTETGIDKLVLSSGSSACRSMLVKRRRRTVARHQRKLWEVGGLEGREPTRIQGRVSRPAQTVMFKSSRVTESSHCSFLCDHCPTRDSSLDAEPWKCGE
jgi:hypothetical protein